MTVKVQAYIRQERHINGCDMDMRDRGNDNDMILMEYEVALVRYIVCVYLGNGFLVEG